MVALVAAAVQEVRGFGVGAGDDDARHAHDVQLEARGGEPLDLLVNADEHLASLVAALLRARALILDVVAGYADLDKAPDQVAHMCVAAVSRVGVGDDERPVVDRIGRGSELLGRHARAQVGLVLVGGQQRTDDRRGLVGNLGERVAREVGARVLGDAALGGRRPATEVDALDPMRFIVTAWLGEYGPKVVIDFF